MDDEQQLPRDLRDELQQLGSNLKAILEAAWESDERRKAQAEVASALSEAAAALSSAARELAESPAGQKIKAEVEEWGELLRRSQVRAHARTELLEALHKVNTELAELAARWRASAGEDDQSHAPRGEA